MNRTGLYYLLVFSAVFILSYCAKSIETIAVEDTSATDSSAMTSGIISSIEPQIAEINAIIDSLYYLKDLFDSTENVANKKNIQLMVSDNVAILSVKIGECTTNALHLQDSLNAIIVTFAPGDSSEAVTALRLEFNTIETYSDTELRRIHVEYEKFLCLAEGRVCTVVVSSSSFVAADESSVQPIETISSSVSVPSSTGQAVSSAILGTTSSVAPPLSSTVPLSSAGALSSSSQEGTMSSATSSALSSNVSSTLSSTSVSSQLSSPSSSVSSSAVISSATSSSQVVSSSLAVSSALSSSSVVSSAISSSSLISSAVSSSSALSSALSSSSVFTDTTEILNINGTSRYIDIRNGITSDWQSNGISMELWTLWDTFDQHTHLIHLSNGNNYNYMIALGIFEEKSASDTMIYLKYAVSNASNGNNESTWARDSIDNVFTKGKWSHVAVTVTDSGRVTFYVNGFQRQSTLIGPKAVPDNVWRGTNNIGFGTENWDGNFDGRLDNVRIWNRALSADEVKDNMFNTTDLLPDVTSLVISYDFNYDSTEPTVVQDLSGNGFHGDLIGMTGQYGYDKDWRDQVDFRTKVP